MIGSPSEPSFSDTSWKILILAAEALDYERRHPNDKYPAFTLSYGPDECDRLNFTSDNSSFGIDVNDPYDWALDCKQATDTVQIPPARPLVR